MFPSALLIPSPPARVVSWWVPNTSPAGLFPSGLLILLYSSAEFVSQWVSNYSVILGSKGFHSLLGVSKSLFSCSIVITTSSATSYFLSHNGG